MIPESSTMEGASLVNRLIEVRSPMLVTVARSRPAEPARWWMSTAVLLALVMLGTALRGAAWLSERDLWIDESMLALNLVGRSPARLLEPLDWNQGAPTGFLLAEKATIGLVGVSERGLRLLPCAGSLLGFFAFAWLAPRLLPRPAAMLAVLLFSVSPFLISYAAECKQYATDAAIGIGLFACAASLLHGAGGLRRWTVLAAAGAMAVWFSHPATFILGGIGAALLLESLLHKDRGRFLAASATAAAWLASFGLCYVLFLKNLGNNQYLLDYWDGHFLPLPPKSPGDLAWLLDHFFAPFAYPGGLGGTEIRAGGIAAVLFVIGIAGLARQCRPIAVALVVPGVLALAASALHKYPFAGRLLLFLVPLMILGVAHGAAMVGAALGRSQPFASLVLLGVLVAAPCLETYQELNRPMRHEQIQPILEQVRGEWQPGDRVYIYYGALPAFTFYTRQQPFPEDAIIVGTEARDNLAKYRQQLAELKGRRRVWLLFSHRHKNEQSIIQAYAEGLGRCEGALRAPGAAAFLFNFAVPPEMNSVAAAPTGADRARAPGDITRGSDR
jgi:hypothetical protein